MPETESKNGPHLSRPIVIFAAVVAAWAVFVVFYVWTMPPDQGLLGGGALFGVGCLIAGMGYLSMLRRSAMKARQDSLQRILEKRRMEREKGNEETREQDNKVAREQGKGTR